MRRARIFVTALGAVLAAAGFARAQQADTFPHAAHTKVFPSCTGCHAGTVTEGAPMSPDVASCNGCHDGKTTTDSGKVLRTVRFAGATPLASNLAYSHLLHAEKTNTLADTRACIKCHQMPNTTAWMSVGRAYPEACLACHEHEAPSHLASAASCGTCHVPLAQATALAPAQIAAFPKPESHSSPDFLATHAPADSASAARCAICHTQESCARCHMNAKSVASIQALGSNPAVAKAVAGKGGDYPKPASHDAVGFATMHADLANATNATCGNCHARASCQTCHLTLGAREAIGRLPNPKAGVGPQGVQLRRANQLQILYNVSFRSLEGAGKVTIVHVHPPDFMKSHNAAAASANANCQSCHVQRYCADCHDGVGRVKYHTPNWLQGHAAAAYGREQDCASCHNNEAFCVSCHVSTGIGATGTRNGATHNQSPNWLVDHGQAARYELQNCASCHKQSDCIACHSTITWGVNPHGPDFNASLMATRNTYVCYYCHVGNPTAH